MAGSDSCAVQFGGRYADIKCIPADYHGQTLLELARSIVIADPLLTATEEPASPTRDAPKPRYDLVAIDLDGTLLRSDKKVARYDAVAIRQAMRRGVKVVLATARPPRSARILHAKLGLDTPLINYNGALIHNVQQARHIFHEPLAADTARAVVRLARTLEPKVVVSIEVLDKWYTDHDDPTLQTETAKKFKPDFIGPLDVPLQDAVTKIMLLASKRRLKRVRQAVIAAFEDRAAFMESDDHIMQVVHQEVDKGRALSWVASSYGIPAARVCAIGDAPNDTGMLQWAGLGCAVANSFGTVRDAADVILEHTNDQWAVGRAIEKYVLEDDIVARQVAQNAVKVGEAEAIDNA